MSHRQYFADSLVGAVGRGITFLTVEQFRHARKEVSAALQLDDAPQFQQNESVLIKV